MSKSVWKRTTGALVLCLVATPARAEQASARSIADDATRARAAELFERGVREFEGQDFASASRTFLQVDELAPSDRALSNALSAARRAGLHLVVVQIAERARGRADVEPEARKLIDRALMDAAKNLTLVEIVCKPAACKVWLDGTVLTGPRYVEPGEHVYFTDRDPKRNRFACRAGDSVSMVAYGDVPTTPPPPADSGTARPPSAPGIADAERPARQKPMRPWVVVAGAAATAGLAGVTVWSGLNTLSERDRHAPDSPSYDPDDIHARARRTDFLLAGTAVLAGATAVIGVFFVDWNGKARAGATLLPGGGAFVSAAREF